MKAFLLFLIGAAMLGLAGCETDVPRDPSQPAVKFGNDQLRDDSHDRPAGRAIDRDKTAW